MRTHQIVYIAAILAAVRAAVPCRAAGDSNCTKRPNARSFCSFLMEKPFEALMSLKALKPLTIALGAIALALGTGELRADGSHSHEAGSSETAIAEMVQKMTLSVPDIDVADQNGRRLKFVRDLVQGRTVAINFIYTDCKSICPMLTANFAAVQDELGDVFGRDIFFVSISLDPQHDTSEKLATFAAQFGVKSGWSFVTGNPAEISTLLKTLNANVSAREDHTALALIGNGQLQSDGTTQWTRVYGLDAPKEIAALLKSVALTDETQRKNYFTNLPLQDQNGRALRFYDDMVRNKLVVITSFYGSCTDVCPLVAENLRLAQASLPPEVRDNVRMIGLTVDADHDTPEALRDFAANHALDDHWSLLTGKKDNVNWVLHKLGLYVEKSEDHSSLILIGNDHTGNWAKMLAMEQPRIIARSIQTLSVTN